MTLKELKFAGVSWYAQVSYSQLRDEKTNAT